MRGRARKENPCRHYVIVPIYGQTHVRRFGQLPTNQLLCGIQSAYIRLKHRRSSPPRIVRSSFEIAGLKDSF